MSSIRGTDDGVQLTNAHCQIRAPPPQKKKKKNNNKKQKNSHTE